MHEWTHYNGNGKLDQSNIVEYCKIIMLTHDFDKGTRTFNKNFIARRENFFKTPLSVGLGAISWGVIFTPRVFVTTHAARAHWGV